MTDSWRFIDTGPCKAAFNMAIDEAIAIAVRKGNSPPTLRIYRWDMPSVSIGCFQQIRDINVGYCGEKGIPIVRRLTGGRAILHNHEITYSFSTKIDSELFSKGLLDSYEKISRVFVLALSKLGLNSDLKLQKETHHSSSTQTIKSPLCFQSTSYGEVIVKNKKIIGSAQKRWVDGFLQQGSLPFSVNMNEMVKVFRFESSGEVDKIIGLKEILPDLKLNDLKDYIRISFEETFDVKLTPSYPSHEEISLAEELEVKKYLMPEWNFQR